MSATIVEIGLTISGTLASFDQTKRDGLKSTLRTELSCFEPTCLLELDVTAGSINVAARMTIPDAGGGSDAAAAVSAVSAAANTLVAKPISELASVLDVAVVGTSPVQVATGVSVSIVVAPPPPSPPPPVSPAVSASPPPAEPPAPISALKASSGDRTGLFAGVAVGAAVAVIAIAAAVYLKLKKKAPRFKVGSTKQPGFEFLGESQTALGNTVSQPTREPSKLFQRQLTIEEDGLLSVIKSKDVEPIDMATQLVMGRQLGSGSFGNVFKGKYGNTEVRLRFATHA